MNEKKIGIGMHDSNRRPIAVVGSGDLTAAIREFEGAESESECRFDVYRTNPETGV